MGHRCCGNRIPGPSLSFPSPAEPQRCPTDAVLWVERYRAGLKLIFRRPGRRPIVVPAQVPWPQRRDNAGAPDRPGTPASCHRGAPARPWVLSTKGAAPMSHRCGKPVLGRCGHRPRGRCGSPALGCPAPQAAVPPDSVFTSVTTVTPAPAHSPELCQRPEDQLIQACGVNEVAQLPLRCGHFTDTSTTTL